MKRVVIVGASYAGLYTLKQLAKNKNLDIVVFDKNNYHYAQVESYGLASSIYEESDVTVNIEKYINKIGVNVKFYKDEIVSFDSLAKRVITKNHEECFYDYLIIATGSLTNFPAQVSNIKKYSHGIKTLNKAVKVKKEFNKIIEKSILKKTEKYNIVIGGAGLAGVEIAAEMANYLQLQESLYNKNLNVNIVLLDGLETVLPNMDERLIYNCKKRLEDLGVDICLGSFIKDVDEDNIYLANETYLPYDYFVFTGGIKAVNLKSYKEYKINKINQYLTDEYLHLNNEKDIFVIGDAAEVIYDNRYIAPTAQLAIQSGKYVSSYIEKELEEKKQKKFKPKSKGILISLGGSYALGLVYDSFFIKGKIAHLIKKYTTKLHKNKFR